MIRCFPIGKLSVHECTNRHGDRCPDKVWFTDTHEAPRGRYRHEAQDIFAPEGSEFVAPETGIVIGVGEGDDAGHWLRLYAPESHRTYYASHLAEAPCLEIGAAVDAGELLGLVGRTGNAKGTCPHLHLRCARGRDRKRKGRWRRGPAINIYRELRDVPGAP